MKNSRLKMVFRGSLGRDFLFISIISVIIMIFGITYGISMIRDDSRSGMINKFNQAFVEIRQFVNRNDANCEAYLNSVCRLREVNGAVIDKEGNILMKSDSVTLDKIDTNKIKNIYQGRYKDENIYQKYEIGLDDKTYDLLIWHKDYDIEYLQKKFIAIIIVCCIIAILNIYIFTNNKVKYIKNLAKGIDEFSKGNLDYVIDKKGNDELSFLAEGMNSMAQNLKAKIETEREQEKFKTELITNVSHDLRTPLTSLIGYLQLVNNEKTTEENKKKYTEISIEKAYKLRDLIGDLFEYSKLESGGVNLEKSNINIVEIVEQSIGELYIESKNRNMVFKKEYFNGNINLYVDSNKIGRVFENILSNAVKYGIKDSDICINIIEGDEFVTVSFENEVTKENFDDVEKVFERFYRRDISRNSNVSGSGLGLAIAKNIVNLHGGDIWAESLNNMFKICVKLPKMRA